MKSTMGRVAQVYLDDKRVYCCSKCQTQLALADDIINNVTPQALTCFFVPSLLMLLHPTLPQWHCFVCRHFMAAMAEHTCLMLRKLAGSTPHPQARTHVTDVVLTHCCCFALQCECDNRSQGGTYFDDRSAHCA